MTEEAKADPDGLPSAPPATPPGDRSAAVETVVAALSSALLFAMFLLLPVAGSVALAFAGVPLVRLTHRRGFAAGLVGTVLAAGLLAGVGAASGGAPEAAAGAVLAVVAIGLPVAFTAAVRRGMSPSAAFLLLAVCAVGLLTASLLLRERLGGRSVRQEMGAIFDAMTPAPAGKGVDADTAARMAAAMTRFKEFAQTYWLGLAAASTVLAAAVTFYAGAVAGRPAESAERTRFETLRVPAVAVAVFVLAGAGWALLRGAGRAVAGDVLLPLLALYFLVGLSIICHFARRWFRSRILRAGLYALVVYFPLNVAVGLLGIFDWYADFRRRGEKA